MKKLILSGTVILAMGCGAFEKLTGGGGSKEEPVGAVAELQDAGGSFVGVAFFSEAERGTQVALRLRGLEPGEYAVHIHEFAAAPGDFESAGGHYNPFGREHGLLNPKGPHAGDLPNITVGENGSFEGTIEAPLVTLKGSDKGSLFKSGGTSLVIHGAADDGKSLGSAKRVACGPIRKPDAAAGDSYRKVQP